jgi:uncharacterized protein YxeA
MKKIIITLFVLLNILSSNVYSDYNKNLDSDPYFMEDVYSFIETKDITTKNKLGYCEEVYLKATRRREYTHYETSKCSEYFIQKNNEEMAYMKYMFNNRELFY